MVTVYRGAGRMFRKICITSGKEILINTFLLKKKKRKSGLYLNCPHIMREMSLICTLLEFTSF
jgi:hypothetical protein